jgi:hypothetical protein
VDKEFTSGLYVQWIEEEKKGLKFHKTTVRLETSHRFERRQIFSPFVWLSQELLGEAHKKILLAMRESLSAIFTGMTRKN